MNNPANDIVNLNRARKQKNRIDNEKRAVENRMKFGRTGAQKKQDAKERDDFARHVDEHQGEEN